MSNDQIRLDNFSLSASINIFLTYSNFFSKMKMHIQWVDGNAPDDLLQSLDLFSEMTEVCIGQLWSTDMQTRTTWKPV